MGGIERERDWQFSGIFVPLESPSISWIPGSSPVGVTIKISDLEMLSSLSSNISICIHADATRVQSALMAVCLLQVNGRAAPPLKDNFALNQRVLGSSPGASTIFTI